MQVDGRGWKGGRWGEEGEDEEGGVGGGVIRFWVCFGVSVRFGFDLFRIVYVSCSSVFSVGC